jgi:hypothetical protein
MDGVPIDKIQHIDYRRAKNNDILDRVVSKYLESQRNKKPLKEHQMFEGLKKKFTKKSKKKTNKKN